MARLGSTPQYPQWSSSPSMGRLPDDPYYKLRLQAEMNALGKSVSQLPVRPRVPTPTRVVDPWSARYPESVVNAAAMLAAVATPIRQVRTYAPPAPTASPPAPTSNPPVAPSLEPAAPSREEIEEQRCDPVVVSEQAENEAWLRVRAPQAFTELKLARKRLDEAADLGGYEQCAVLAHALESLRRAMNKLADAIYPPAPGAVADRLGKEAPTHERAYKARISLALQGATDSKGKHRLAERELALHHQRLTELVERIANGVHGEGDFEESRQLHVGTWQIVASCRLYIPLQGVLAG